MPCLVPSIAAVPVQELAWRVIEFLRWVSRELEVSHWIAVVVALVYSPPELVLAAGAYLF